MFKKKKIKRHTFREETLNDPRLNGLSFGSCTLHSNYFLCMHGSGGKEEAVVVNKF